MKNGFFITAEIKVKDYSKIELAKKELLKLQQETLTEPGCDFFSIQQDNNEPSRFIMWERFNNENAFQKHFELKHTKDFVSKDLTEIVQYFQTNVIDK